jgi:hypothetical protein
MSQKRHKAKRIRTALTGMFRHDWMSVTGLTLAQMIQKRQSYYDAHPEARPMPRARVEALARKAREDRLAERDAELRKASAWREAEYNRIQAQKEAAEAGYEGKVWVGPVRESKPAQVDETAVDVTNYVGSTQ